MTTTKRRRGFSLIEAAIVLAVVGLVLGGIWWAASAIREEYAANKISDSIMVIYNNSYKILRSSNVPDNVYLHDSKLGWDLGIFKGTDVFKLSKTNEIESNYSGLDIIEIEYSGTGGPVSYLTFYPLFKKRSLCEKVYLKLGQRLRGKKVTFYIDEIGKYWNHFPELPTESTVTSYFGAGWWTPDWCTSLDFHIRY